MVDDPAGGWKRVLAALAVRMIHLAYRTYEATKNSTLQGTCYFPMDRREHLLL